MLSFLVSLLHGVFSFLAGFLPDSPLAGVVDTLDGADVGLGWLNWFVPVGDMLALLGLWLAALLVWVAVTSGLRTVRDVALSVVGA